MKGTLKQIYDTLYYSSILHPQHRDLQNSDKGTLHSYIDFYETEFAPYRNRPIRLLEVGVQGGISVLLWKNYFTQGDITGVDIDFSTLQSKVADEARNSSQIHLVKADAATPSLLTQLTGKYDIIIDDGSHHFSHQIATFAILKDMLADGGTYIIEDIQSELESKWLNRLIPNSEIIDLRHVKGRYDDLVLRYRRPLTENG